MLNKVILIGRLTKDPELRYLTSGTSVATFTLAVDRNFTNQQGEREADFLPIVAWRKLGETCANYLTKGRMVAVCGRIQTRSYEGQDGQRRYITEIVADEVRFLDRGNTSGSLAKEPVPDKDTQTYDQREDDFFSEAVEDDELPF
ncbi:MAG: single-stranded DNA-binding protein [Mahellales bacterium]|jgi:single-strand DNA-binding protein